MYVVVVDIHVQYALRLLRTSAILLVPGPASPTSHHYSHSKACIVLGSSHEPVMSIQALPTEILALVLRFVGAEQFRASLDRLTVSKQWYRIAQSVLVEGTTDFKLSGRNLHKFPPSLSWMRNVLKSRLVRLHVHFTGIDATESHLTSSPQDDPWDPHHAWRDRLSDRLVIVSDFASQCRELRSLHLTAGRVLAGSTFLGTLSIDRLLTATSTSLAELVINTANASFEGQGHVCATIARRIPTLRRLDLFLSKICQAVLTFGPNTDLKSFPLQEVTIRSSHQDPATGSMYYTRPCSDINLSWRSLSYVMFVGTVDFARELSSAESVRLILHDRSEERNVRTYDCLHWRQSDDPDEASDSSEFFEGLAGSDSDDDD